MRDNHIWMLILTCIFVFLALYFFLIRPNAQRKKREREENASEMTQTATEQEKSSEQYDGHEGYTSGYEKQAPTYCRYCGSLLTEGQFFCEQCGRQVRHNGSKTKL